MVCYEWNPTRSVPELAARLRRRASVGLLSFIASCSGPGSGSFRVQPFLTFACMQAVADMHARLTRANPESQSNGVIFAFGCPAFSSQNTK